MKPLVKKKLLMEKFAGKGGWTYVHIPKLPAHTIKHRGHVRVKGTIDGFKISKYNLAPMTDGRFFLPIRIEIRKKIGKEAGAMVEVILYPDNEPVKAPKELLQCLADDPAALKFFNTLTDSNKKYYIDWIYSAKHVETKANRIAKTMDRLARGLKMYDAEK
jgi:hypothetical protein